MKNIIMFLKVIVLVLRGTISISCLEKYEYWKQKLVLIVNVFRNRIVKSNIYFDVRNKKTTP